MSSEDKVLGAIANLDAVLQDAAQENAKKQVKGKVDVLGTVDVGYVNIEKTVYARNIQKQGEYAKAVTESAKMIRATNERLREIEDKSFCGTVKVLDHVANWIESVSVSLHNLAVWVRSKTTKIHAPCSISFKK